MRYLIVYEGTQRAVLTIVAEGHRGPYTRASSLTFTERDIAIAHAANIATHFQKTFTHPDTHPFCDNDDCQRCHHVGP